MVGVKLHPALWLVIILLSALPWTRGLGMVAASLWLHEWAHAFAAKWCGGEVESFRLGPFGMMARVRKLDNLHPRLRLWIYAAGPLANLAAAWWTYTVHHLSYIGVFWLRDLAFYNLVLALFNLLPLLPLDGGRLAQHFLGNIFGVLRANRFLLRLGKVAAVLMLVLGIVQMILFSYNITLICAAVFLLRKNTSMQSELRLEAFQILQKKPVTLCGERGKKTAKIKTLTVSGKFTVARALDRLGWSYLRIFKIKTDKDEYLIFDEPALLSHLFSPANTNHTTLNTPLRALFTTEETL